MSFLTAQTLSPTPCIFLFETAFILFFMNIMLSFIWYLIKSDQIVLCTVSLSFVNRLLTRNCFRLHTEVLTNKTVCTVSEKL